MAFILADRVQETATANTTVSFTLSGAMTSYQSFAAIGNGNTTYYGATDGTNWECGLGTYSTSGPTLTRTTILSSSNSGSAVTFSGTVTVWVDYPAGKQISSDYPNAIGVVTPAAGTFTTITGQTEVLKGTGQNLLTYSQPLNTGWTKNATATVTDNNATAPDGTSTAALISCPAGADYIYQIPTTVVGSLYTFSYYIKNSTATTSFAQIRTNSTALSVTITWSAGVPTPSIITGTGTVSATSVGSGWYRLVMSYTCAEASARHRIYGGDGTSVGGNIFVWGVQLELGSTANTYIPTTTTAIYGTPTLSFSGVAGLGLQSDGSLYVSPAGTGALQAQATTSSTVGGNARGANAVDWQTARGAANQVASSAYSTIGGGSNNRSAGSWAVIGGGYSNVVSGNQTLVFGGSTNTASLDLATVGGGYNNTAAGYFNFIGAGYTNSGTSGSAVTTQSATMNGTTTVTLAASNASIKVGQLITGTSIASYTYVAAISGTTLTLSVAASGSSTSTLSFYTPHGVVVGGGNNQATGAYSFIGGGGDAGTAANRNSVASDWGVAVGGFKNTVSATGICNTIVGGYGNTISGGQHGSFIGGGGTYNGNSNPNTITNSAAVITGGISNNNSSFVGFIGGGYTNNASGANYSTIVGGSNNTANSSYSFVSAGYYGTTRGIEGNHVFPACNVPIASASGVSQSALLVLGVQTTDATATVLRSNTSAASGTNQVILPNNSAYYFKGSATSVAQFVLTTTAATGTGSVATLTFAAQSVAPYIVGQSIVVAGVTPTGYNGTQVVTACTNTTVSYSNATSAAQTIAGTTTGSSYCSSWSFEGQIMRSSSAAGTRIVGTPMLNRVAADSFASNWTLALSADTTNGGLAITFTGSVGTTIRTVAKLETTEVTF